jgi:hypothetical protein
MDSSGQELAPLDRLPLMFGRDINGHMDLAADFPDHTLSAAPAEISHPEPRLHAPSTSNFRRPACRRDFGAPIQAESRRIGAVAAVAVPLLFPGGTLSAFYLCGRTSRL